MISAYKAIAGAPANKGLQRTARCAHKIGAILKSGFGPTVFPIYRCAAAEAQGVRPSVHHSRTAIASGSASNNDPLSEVVRMITQATQQLNAALLHDHLDDVLCTLLQLMLAVEAVIQSSARVFEARLTLVERQEHASTIAVLRDRDMLSFLSAAPPETTLALRQLIQTSQSTQVAEWYRQQWDQPDYSTELILASIANSLRPIMTIVLGNTALLSRLITLSTEELAALQPISDAIEILRASRTQIQNYLASKGIAIQSF